MDPKAMQPHGQTLLAYFEGLTDAQLVVRRDDGQVGQLPVSHFFRVPSEFTPIEKAAIQLCKGRVLDIGAGTGIHSLVLQEKGLDVTAIDVSPQAVKIMSQRGVKRVYCEDILQFRNEPFDTLLMLGHGIGMVENIAGLERFLSYAHGLLSVEGNILLDSLDVRTTDDPKNLAYHEANRKAGRYIGEIRIQFEYENNRGPFCGWLHVDAHTLRKYAEEAGWISEVIRQEENGDYLARLTSKSIENEMKNRPGHR